MKKENNTLRCALIFLGPFPDGNVSSIRILSYCKALAKEGVFVKVLIIAPTAEAAINEYKSGSRDGVEYQYITNITWKNKNTPNYVKFFYYIVGFFKSLKYLRQDKINCLLSYHNELLSNVFYRIVTKLIGISFIIDKTEYPNGYFKMSKFRKRIEHFKLKMFDGFILITKELEMFYAQLTDYEPEKYFLLPMTIDADRYKGITKSSKNKRYIAVVFGTHNRDGLYDSVIAYHKYYKLKGHLPLDLVLIGDFFGLCQSFPECKAILNYIKINNLESNVDFKGLVPINDVPDILTNAECLLTTPLEYVSGGFPTKLGEYLLSGVAVVATSAGEIQNYLTHKKNILLSSPGDLDDIAQNILFIDKNRNQAHSIGESGKDLAMKVFNADTYSKSLIEFLKSFQH
jgi:glycosyltransferase involved in cell wall biosynthesis